MLLMPLIAASVAAGQVSAADAADLRCVALFSMMAGEMPEEKAGMTGAIMYYIGRIDGRGSGLNFEAGIEAGIAAVSESEDRFKAEAKRCGNEMVVKGEQVERIGDGIAAGPEKPPAKK